MRTVLVTLIGPERTTDLVVDADTPVTELMPSLLAAGGEGEADPAAWGVAVMGRQPIPVEQTLEESEVLDGSVLVLRRQQTVAREPLPTAGSQTASGSPLAAARERLSGRDPLEPAIAGVRLARCPTIAIASPKGGVGKTTLSIMLGQRLAQLRQEPILALDADSDYGSLARVTPTRSQNANESDRDAGVFEALGQGAMTFADLDRTLWKLPGGLRPVPSPRDPTAMARTDRATYARVIGNLQRLAGVLILDCGTGLAQPGVQASILACDQLVLVTDATGATASLVTEAKRLLDRTGRPITIVCNRLRRGRFGDDLARVDAMFRGAGALVGIPEDPAAELALRGELSLEQAPRPLVEAVTTLAAVLALEWPSLGLGQVD